MIHNFEAFDGYGYLDKKVNILHDNKNYSLRMTVDFVNILTMPNGQEIEIHDFSMAGTRILAAMIFCNLLYFIFGKDADLILELK